MIALLVSFILILPPNTLIFSPSRLAALRIFIANSYHWASRTARSSPMDMNCDFSSTCGDDSGFSLHPWRCSAGDLARTRPIIANSYHWAPRPPGPPPRSVERGLGSACGDGSGLSPHPVGGPGGDLRPTRPIIANSYHCAPRPARSSPMDMNCDFSSTCGDDSGFSLHPWRCSAGDLARTRPIIANSYHWAPARPDLRP